MKYIALFACLTFVMSSCEQQSKEFIKSDRENIIYTSKSRSEYKSSQNNLDWDGTYIGKMHCSKCKIVDAELVLYLDHTFKMTQHHSTNKKNKVTEGSFIWDKDGNHIILNNKNRDIFEITKDVIYHINKNFKALNNKENFVLAKN